MAAARQPPPDTANLGALLKYLRRRARLSQRELAIAVGYSESHLSRIETGERSLDRASLLALFIPALQLQDEPEIMERLLVLCSEQHASYIHASAEPGALHDTVHADVRGAGRLPVPLSSFIGRHEELAEVSALIRTPQVRLLTLSGAGGCGKTRLALRVGELVAPAYADGVWLVELAALSDPHLLLKTIADRFELRERSGRPLSELLIATLQTRQLLLILDNCEHLIDAVAALVVTLLTACPDLHILATSRETLNVPGEQTSGVQPLALPPAQRGEQPSRAAVEAYEAIQLFVERARAAVHTFDLNDQNAPAVSRICRRLDGIPLGIELAAAWVRLLAPEQIAERLETDFGLLIDTHRLVLPRHQTLRAAIDWSYRLLAEVERILLRRLSVFVGGWSLAAAEAITADAELTDTRLPRHAVMAHLNQLVHKSLVVVEHPADGGVRYRLLEVLREYARSELQQVGELQRLGDRHLRHFITLAETIDAELHTRPQARLLTVLEHELENLRAALPWSLLQERAEDGLRLATALGRFWRHTGRYSEGRAWFRALLARETPSSPIRAHALLRAAILARLQGDLPESRRLSDASLVLAARYGDREAIALALENIGWTAVDSGDTAYASTAFRRSLVCVHALGLQRQSARLLATLAQMAREQGDHTRARAQLDAALACARAADDPQSISQVLSGLSELAWLTGDAVETVRLLREGLDLAIAAGDQQDLAWITCSLAESYRALRDVTAARRYGAQSLALFEELGSRRGQAIALHHLGLIELESGNLPAAEERLAHSLRLCRAAQDTLMELRCLAGLGGVVLRQGDPIRATHLLSTATTGMAPYQAELAPADRACYQELIEECHAQLEPGVFERAWAQGTAAVDRGRPSALGVAGRKQ